MRSNAFLDLSVAMLAALAAAGSTSCSSQPVACGGCGCGDSAPQKQTNDISFVPCADASTEAGAEGGACYATCAEACAAVFPSSICTGTGTSDAGAPIASCDVTALCSGRQFEGLGCPELMTSLARMAWLEAASVRAFQRLARELEAHGAPSELVDRARESARDESRHARIFGRIARARGERVPRVTPPKAHMRSLEALATENAVEGCVGETFGAAQAAWRAKSSADPEIARAMGAIAPDELGHAALAWDVARWAESRLDSASLERVRLARKVAATAVLHNTRKSSAEHALARTLFESLHVLVEEAERVAVPSLDVARA